MAKYKDFDQFFKESSERERISLKLYGKVYFLPQGLRASLALKLLRMKKQDDSQEIDVIETALQLLGEENTKEWLEKGITIEQLESLISWAFSAYNFSANVDSKKKS